MTPTLPSVAAPPGGSGSGPAEPDPRLPSMGQRAARGLVLLAHGARDAEWAAPFEAVAARVRASDPALQLRLAYLEFMAPALPEAAAELAAAGCTRIDVLPLFLGAGGHVRRDLPRLERQVAAAHPAVNWRWHPAAGEMPQVVAALADAALSAAQDPDR